MCCNVAYAARKPDGSDGIDVLSDESMCYRHHSTDVISVHMRQ